MDLAVKEGGSVEGSEVKRIRAFVEEAGLLCEDLRGGLLDRRCLLEQLGSELAFLEG